MDGDVGGRQEVSTPWSKLLFDYTQETTLHGLRYTTVPSSGIIRKLIWMAVLMMSFTLFAYLVASKARYLASYPKTINVEVNYNDSLVFPAVTICNSNKYRLTATHKEGLYDLLVHGSQLQESHWYDAPGALCQDTFDLHLRICGYSTEVTAGRSSSGATYYMDPLVFTIAETTRQVCKTLCTQVYGLSCSSVIYDPDNRTCLLTSFTEKHAHLCSDGGETEFYRRRRCPEPALLSCDHETDTAASCPLQSDKTTEGAWELVEARRGNVHADNTLASERGHYRHLPLAGNRPNHKASLYTGYMNTTGKCMALFYSINDPTTASSITVNVIDEDKSATEVLRVTRSWSEYGWSRASVRLPSGLHIVQIEGIRGKMAPNRMAIDDIKLSDCDHILHSECKSTRSGNDYTGRTAASQSGKSCIQWFKASNIRERTPDSLAEIFPDDVINSANDSCRTFAGDVAPSCYVDTHIVEYCNISYCECDEDHFTCGDNFCLPMSMVCDGWEDCLDGSDERDPCASRLSFACEFDDNYICGYNTHSDVECAWGVSSFNKVLNARESRLPTEHPQRGTHYMLLNADLCQNGDIVTLSSSVMSIPEGKSLQFYLYLSASDANREQFQIFVTSAGIRNTRIFSTRERSLDSQTWHRLEVPLPAGHYSLSMMSALETTNVTGSVALASVKLIDNSNNNNNNSTNVTLTEAGTVSCDFGMDSCGYEYVSESTFFAFNREPEFNVDSIPSIQGCGEVYRDKTGEITSPNYPMAYIDRLSCLYYIIQPEGSTISVTFNSFDIEGNPCRDYLKIKDGIHDSVASFEYDQPLCGNSLPRTVAIDSNTASLYFYSDFALTGKGFSLTYNTTYDDATLKFNSKCEWRGGAVTGSSKASIVSVATDIESVSCLALRIQSLATFAVSAHKQTENGLVQRTSLLRSNMMLGVAWHRITVELPLSLGRVYFVYEASGAGTRGQHVAAIDEIVFTPNASCTALYGSFGSLACDFSDELQCGYVDVSPGEFHWLRIKTDIALGMDVNSASDYEVNNSGHDLLVSVPHGGRNASWAESGSGFEFQMQTKEDIEYDYVMGVEVGASGGDFTLLSPKVNITKTQCLHATLYYNFNSSSYPSCRLHMRIWMGNQRQELIAYPIYSWDSNQTVSANLTVGSYRVEFMLAVEQNPGMEALYVWLDSVTVLPGICGPPDIRDRSSTSDSTGFFPIDDGMVTPTSIPPMNLGEPLDQYRYLLNLSGSIQKDEIYRRLAHRIGDMIQLCWWDGMLDNCQAIVAEVTDAGQCLSFNSRSQGVSKTVRTGTDYGLRLLLNIEAYEYTLLDGDLDAGIKVHLHTQEDVASVRDLGFAVSPGVHALAQVTYSETRSLLAPWGNCSEIELDTHNNKTTYTRQRCSLQCEADATFSICGCIGPHMPGFQPQCNLADYLVCVNPETENILSTQSACENKCPNACDVITYQTGLSYVNIRENAVQLMFSDTERNQVRSKYNKAVDTRHRIGEEHMSSLLVKIRSTQALYRAGIHALRTKGQSVLGEVVQAINLLLDMVDQDLSGLLADFDIFAEEYAVTIGPSIDLIQSTLNSCHGHLGTIQSIFYSDNWSAFSSLNNLMNSSEKCLEDGRLILEVYSMYLEEAHPPSEFVPLYLLTTDNGQITMCKDAISMFNTSVDKLVESFASIQTLPSESNRDNAQTHIKTCQANIRTIKTCADAYINFLDSVSDFKHTVIFSESETTASENADAVKAYGQWHDWIETIVETYTMNSISKEELCIELTGRKMAKAKASFNIAHSSIKAVDMAHIQTTLRSQESIILSQYTTALKYIAELQTYFNTDKYENKARGMRIWRQPTANFNHVQILDYKLPADQTWKSWSYGTSLVSFVSNSLSGEQTLSYLLSQYMGELSSALIDVGVSLNRAEDDIASSMSSLQMYCDSYNLSIHDDSAFDMQNILQLDVFYGELKYQYIEQLKGYDVEAFLGEIGGYMGLLLGGSIITLVEFLDLLIYNSLQKISSRSQTEVQPINVKAAIVDMWVK